MGSHPRDGPARSPHPPFLWLGLIFPCSVPSSSPSAGTSPLRLAEGDLSAWEGLEKE
ncbi:Hypothetical predicted protein, partial [Lynx pardinus]